MRKKIRSEGVLAILKSPSIPRKPDLRIEDNSNSSAEIRSNGHLQRN